MPAANDPEPRHFCGSQGFGLDIHDICPKCECERLAELGVPTKVATKAG